MVDLLVSDLKAWLNSKAKKVIFNERDLQLQLAQWLLKSKNYDSVEMEYYVPSDELPDYPWKNPRDKSKKQDLYLDIVVEKDGKFAIVELKFTTKSEDGEVLRFGEKRELMDILKNQGADNIVKYNFWKDVRRIEIVKQHFKKVVGGVALMVTNNLIYTKKPMNNTYKQKFSMAGTINGKNSAVAHPTDKFWTPRNGKNPNLIDHCPNFSVEREYETPWDDVNNCQFGNFIYTFVKIY